MARASSLGGIRLSAVRAAYDPEIKDLLDGANSDPNTVERRIRERFEKRKEKVYQEREGSTVPMLVRFGEFRSHNLWIHLECHNPIAEQEQLGLELPAARLSCAAGAGASGTKHQI